MSFFPTLIVVWLVTAPLLHTLLTACEKAPLTWRVLIPYPAVPAVYSACHAGEGFFSQVPWSKKSKRWKSKRIPVSLITQGQPTLNGLPVTYTFLSSNGLLMVRVNHSFETLWLSTRNGFIKKNHLAREWYKWSLREMKRRPETFNQQPSTRSGGVDVSPPEPPKAEHEVEGAVRLWRIWRHRDGVLYPLTNTKAWCPGENKCDQYPGKHSNSAGFYGFFDLREIKRQEHGHMEAARSGRSDTVDVDEFGRPVAYTYVIGSFLGYGRILEGTMGCRVEYAMPEYLILPDQNDDYAIELMTLADKHGMRPITVEQALTLRAGLVPWVKKEQR